MKHIYSTLTVLFLIVLDLSSQNYLEPEEGFKVAYFSPEHGAVQTFDVDLRYFYYNDGDTIYQLDPMAGGVTMKYGKPSDFTVPAFPSFLNISPDGAFLWAGYTDLNNEDARIYRIDVESGIWEQKARMPSNWDLVFWNDSILVSGLNSADFMTPSGIFVLDTSGLNQHRKIVEVGGSSAGIAVDAQGNLFFGTSSFSEPNALYRLHSVDLSAVIDDVDAGPLLLSDADKLTDIPMAAYDCEVDAADHLIFTMNVPGGTQVLAQWNGTEGVGSNYDTLAMSEQWLGMVKSRGNYASPYLGNSLYTVGYGMPLADLHTIDYPPRIIDTLPVINGYESAALTPVDLSNYVIDLDDHEGMTYEITLLSDDSVAGLAIDQDTLSGFFQSPGQANLYIEATSGEHSISLNTLIATWPRLESGHLLADFEDLSLDPENYWNGSDGSGQFTTGPATFMNDFNTEYFSWSGWAYSNTSDVSTAGYLNQYSAITGKGFPAEEGVDGLYGISSLYGPSVIKFNEKAYAPSGFYVTNSTYATISMEQGDWAAKKFGGEDGSDPDYFMLSTWGFRGGMSTDTIDFYLADFRFEEDAKDYIIKSWQWVDLSSFGKVDSLQFGLESSDMGEWGMNTPAYFCVDNLHILPDAAPYVANPIPDMAIITDGYDHVIDLEEVFSDPDDDDSLIVKTLVNEIDNGPLEVSISGNELTIRTFMLVKSTFEDFEIMVEGSLGGLAVVDTFVITVEILGGLSVNRLPGFDIYPNPSDGRFVISPGTPGEMDVSIYDITGSKVYNRSSLLPGQEVDISAQPAGAYIIRVRQRGGVSSKMLQKL